MGSANILLSYRRADASGMAGRIFDRLSQHYGPGRVFIDIDNIPMGVDFHDHLEAALADCGVLLALIGPKWIGRRPGKPARIHDEDDWVRVEVERAMGFEIPVIPVLLDGAALPKKELLPPSLHPMLRRNGVAIDAGKDFHAHVNRLIEGIDALLGTPRQAAEAPHAAVETPPASAQRSSKWRRVGAMGALIGAGLAVFAFFALQSGKQEETHARWFAAVSEGDVQKIRALLDSGVVTIKTPIDGDANTALHLAAERCDNDAVMFLLALGGDPLRKNVYNESPLRIAQIRCPSPATTAEILGAAASR